MGHGDNDNSASSRLCGVREWAARAQSRRSARLHTALVPYKDVCGAFLVEL